MNTTVSSRCVRQRPDGRPDSGREDRSNGGSWVAAERKGTISMDRQTRRAYFERLCDLRAAYARLGADDATSVISIEAMIARANRLIERRGSPLIMMLDGSAKSA